ncbi:MAG: hypothetical protein H6564_02810 [Lewinellaceae bacterium]|nr:hypothetical protein [Lewinellaceae bacterium]
MEKKNEQFDRVIREKLGSFQAPFDPDSWQLLEQRLDEDAMADAGAPVADNRPLDEVLFDKLHRYEVPYQAANWQKMEALLEEAFAWPRFVLRYKLTELALMALLMLALWQYTPVVPQRAGGPQAWKPDNAAIQQAQQTPENTTKNNEHSAISPTAATAADEREAIPSDINRQQPEKGVAAVAGPYSQPGREISGQLLPLPMRSFSIAHGPEAEGMPISPSLSGLLAFGLLETKNPGLLAYEPGLNGVVPAIQKSRPQPTLRVGMFGSADYNHIMVPPSAEKKISEGFDRYALGYGGGLSVGLEMGRWEVESGALYAARLYPVGLIYVNGSLSDGLAGNELRNSELNILNVPLHIRYNILHRGSWRAYALTGGALQVAFQSNYYTADAPEYSYRPIPGLPEPSPGDEGLLAEVRRNGRGWFEGGTFEENAYLTGNFGIGLERYIDTRWSIFAQPTYQYSLYYFGTGLGPNNDRINSLSVLFGAKVRLH